MRRFGGHTSNQQNGTALLPHKEYRREIKANIKNNYHRERGVSHVRAQTYLFFSWVSQELRLTAYLDIDSLTSGSVGGDPRVKSEP